MNWLFLRRLAIGAGAIVLGAALAVWGIRELLVPPLSAGCLAVVLGFWYMIDTERPTW